MKSAVMVKSLLLVAERTLPSQFPWALIMVNCIAGYVVSRRDITEFRHLRICAIAVVTDQPGKTAMYAQASAKIELPSY
ncbi:hypothetical protein, partial [Mesorhizobium sp. M1A.F.Ca.IN.022.07.1.1]|uniref:hypothetical protein n=1 Tax=Mesorhizobium sp. M1A.F.Ca.IN.022.07.1.1 TaxID=2496767 RepID=UPI0019D0C75C